MSTVSHELKLRRWRLRRPLLWAQSMVDNIRALPISPMAALTAVVGLLLASLALGSGYSYEALNPALAEAAAWRGKEVTAVHATLEPLRREQARLSAALKRTAPSGTYIVVDRSNNRVFLRDKRGVQLAAAASAGSGSILREEDGRRRTWVFDTPQGKFHVLQKVEDPVWRKPDWAFIEEGKTIPDEVGERIEYGALGEYALYFGDGYMIHGTLYERLLGRSVTHGCIRVGKEPLRRIFRAVEVGTPIYIF